MYALTSYSRVTPAQDRQGGVVPRQRERHRKAGAECPWGRWAFEARKNVETQNIRLYRIVNVLSILQSTRPHGARLSERLQIAAVCRVSIHASTRARLCCCSSTGRCSCSFNPHAHEGRDNASRRKTHRSRCFNPRAHGGRDLVSFILSCLQLCFNPRAHGGRDTCGLRAVIIFQCFNPRAHGGRDLIGLIIRILSFLFQSTRPRGARRTGGLHIQRGEGFNPRAHGGRDGLLSALLLV